jgi:hypothetical protein
MEEELKLGSLELIKTILLAQEEDIIQVLREESKIIDDSGSFISFIVKTRMESLK